MQITKANVSVYEIELDLSRWDTINSAELPGFPEALVAALPSIESHHCMVGSKGGFIEELKKGTNLAHVIEHILLELLHLSDPDKQVYSGWTRQVNSHIFTIHFGAPDFLTGRLAAILSVEMVKKIINGEKVSLHRYIQLLKDPIQYFTQDEKVRDILANIIEPPSSFDGFEIAIEKGETVELTEQQKEEICDTVKEIRRYLPNVDELWQKSFVEYGGEFARKLIDKLRLFNLDQYAPVTKGKEVECYFYGIRKVAQLAAAYRIPRHFTLYSIWLYRSQLLKLLGQHYQEQPDKLYHVTRNFETFYQNVMKAVISASTRFVLPSPESDNELKAFREKAEATPLILMVDDDAMIRRMTGDMLEMEGYRVLEAASGKEAVQLFIEYSDQISLVMLDLLLPDLGGMDVFNRIRKIRPDIQVIFVSGYPVEMEEVEKQGSQFHFLKKPFEFKSLFSLLRDLLPVKPGGQVKPQ